MANPDIIITVESQAPRATKELKDLADQSLVALRATKQLSSQGSLDKHFASIDRQISRVNANMSNYSRFTSQAANSSGQFGVVTQQAGYQIGDFLVQIQSGTNWMVAFGQQATQLVGVLPLMGAGFMGLSTGALVALSAGLGIAIPLITAIGAAFMRTGEESKTSVDKTVAAIDILIQRTQEAAAKIKELQTGVPEEEQAVLDEINVLQEQRLALIQEMLNKSYELQKLQAETGQDYAYILEGYQENIALLNEEILGKEEVLRLDKERAQQLKDIEGSLKFGANFITIVAERALDAAEASSKISFSNATAEAAALADELERAAKQAVLVGGGRGLSAGGPSANPDPYGFRAQLERDKAKVSVGGGSGGGGGRSSRLKEEISLTVKLTEAEKERQSVVETVNGTLEDGFLDMVKGTKTVGEAFRSMAAAIIEELFRVLVVQKLVGGITSAFGGGKTFTNVAGLTGGGRASGGSMMSGSSYLVGENGPELVIPRHSGTVLNANQTSGAMAGSGGFTQNLSINVSGSDAAMVRQEVAKMIPQITNATKAAVIDAKQRGGQMGAAFR